MSSMFDIAWESGRILAVGFLGSVGTVVGLAGVGLVVKSIDQFLVLLFGV